jgi:hypothetical protein
MGKIALQVFLLPRDLMCDAIGARTEGDRSATRSCVNIFVWNLAVVL